MTVSVVTSFEANSLFLSWEREKEQCENDVPTKELMFDDNLMAFARPSPKQRSVRFSADPVSACHKIEHINDFTDEEVENAWYSREEFKEIRDEYNITAGMVVSECNLNEEEYCPRGLERKTDKGARKREIAKLSSIGAVLREQHRQYLLGLPNELAIARAYIGETQSGKDFARKLAVADELDVAKQNAQVSLSIEQNENVPDMITFEATPTQYPSKMFQLKRFLCDAGNRRRAVLDDLIALTSSSTANSLIKSC